MQHKDFQISFIDFRILNINFNINEKIPIEKKSIPIKAIIGTKYTYEKENKELQVFLKVEIKDDKMPFAIFVEGKGIFKFKESPTNGVLKNMAKINCPAIIFPYIRETIADITRRAGFSPLHLNPINFVALAKRSASKRDKKKNI